MEDGDKTRRRQEPRRNGDVFEFVFDSTVADNGFLHFIACPSTRTTRTSFIRTATWANTTA
ncbi:MAG TPA: hypothetical protein VGD67_05415 [Pseudonocardiaceae bacterium]